MLLAAGCLFVFRGLAVTMVRRQGRPEAALQCRGSAAFHIASCLLHLLEMLCWHETGANPAAAAAAAAAAAGSCRGTSAVPCVAAAWRLAGVLRMRMSWVSGLHPACGMTRPVSGEGECSP